MGNKCCTVFDNKSCRSGYSSDKSGIRVISFPSNIEEKTRWVLKQELDQVVNRDLFIPQLSLVRQSVIYPDRLL